MQMIQTGLAFRGDLLEIVVRVLLGHELLDHLVDICHARRLLDLLECLLERHDARRHGLHLPLVGLVLQALGHQVALEPILLLLAHVARRLHRHALALRLARLHLGVHLLTELHLSCRTSLGVSARLSELMRVEGCGGERRVHGGGCHLIATQIDLLVAYHPLIG